MSLPPCPTFALGPAPTPDGQRVSGFEIGDQEPTPVSQDAGPRTPVFLVPAFGLDGSSYRELAPACTGRRAFAWNPPNDLPDGATLSELAQIAVDAAELAGLRSPAVWIGSSFGGMLALQAALDHPSRVAGLLLFGTAPKWNALHWRTRAVRCLHPLIRPRNYHRTLARVMFPGGGDDPRLVALRAQMERRTKRYVGAVVHALRVNGGYDLTPRLRDLRVPTMVLHGERDGVAPLARARGLASAPGLDFRVLAGAGHLPYVFRPELVVQPVRSFLLDADARLSG